MSKWMAIVPIIVSIGILALFFIAPRFFSKRKIRNFQNFSNGLFRFCWIILKLGILPVIIISFIFIWEESGKDTYVIYPFNVPDLLKRDGITEDLLASQLLEKIQLFDRESREYKSGSSQYVVTEPYDFEIQLPGFSGRATFQKFIQWVRRKRDKKPNEITCTLVTEDSNIWVRFEPVGSSGVPIVFNVEQKGLTLKRQVDIMLFQSSLRLARELSPIQLATFYLNNENYQQAIEAIRWKLSDVKLLKNERKECYEILALAYQGDKKPFEAINMYQQVLSFDSLSIKAYQGLGYAYYNLNKIPEAIKSYSRAITIDSVNANATLLNNLGGAYWQQSDRAMRSYYYKSIQKDSTNIYALLNLGQLSALNNKFEEATKYFDQAFKFHPDFVWKKVHLETSATVGHTQISKVTLDSLGECMKENDVSYKYYFLYKGLCPGDFSEKLNYVDQSLSLDSKFTAALFLKANMLCNEKNFAEANEYYKQVTQLSPNFIEGYRCWGENLISQGDSLGAKEKLLIALERSNYDVASYSLLALWINASDKRESIFYYRSAELINPVDSTFLRCRLRSLMDEEDFEGVFRFANLILEKNPNNYEALNALYWVNSKKNNYETTEKIGSRMLELFPDDVSTVVRRALYLETQQNYVEAEQLLKNTIENYGEKFGYYSSLGHVYYAQGKLDLAVKSLEKAVSLNDKNSIVMLQYGAYLAEQGFIKKAANVFKIAFYLDPSCENLAPWKLCLETMNIDYMKIPGKLTHPAGAC